MAANRRYNKYLIDFEKDFFNFKSPSVSASVDFPAPRVAEPKLASPLPKSPLLSTPSAPKYPYSPPFHPPSPAPRPASDSVKRYLQYPVSVQGLPLQGLYQYPVNVLSMGPISGYVPVPQGQKFYDVPGFPVLNVGFDPAIADADPKRVCISPQDPAIPAVTTVPAVPAVPAVPGMQNVQNVQNVENAELAGQSAASGAATPSTPIPEESLQALLSLKRGMSPSPAGNGGVAENGG